MNTIFIVLPILTILMFDLGLVLKPADFKLIAERPKPVLVGLIGQIILLPLVAWGMIQATLFFPSFDHSLTPFFIIGIMLVACSPGGSSSNVFSMLAKGDVALSVTLTACSSIITLFTLPLIMAWVTAEVGETVNIHLPVGKLLMQNIVLMVMPISVGFIINILYSRTAEKIHNVLKRIAMPALVLLVTIFFIQHCETIVAEFASLGLMMSVLILATTGCGAALAWGAKLTGKERRTLVIEIGMQNAAQAITIACSPLIFNNEIIAIPAIIYALMMNLILLAYVGLTKLKNNMKHVLTLIACVWAGVLSASVINYQADDATIFPNPERGFTDQLGGEKALSDNNNHVVKSEEDWYWSQWDSHYGERKNQSIVMLMYYLKNYRTKDLSDQLLQGFNEDMQILRNHGFKCVLRFAYDWNSGNDASLTWVQRHATQLKPYLAANADVIYVMEAGFVGQWGEWYYSSNFGNETQKMNNNRKAVLTAVLDACPADRFVLTRYPLIKIGYMGDENTLTLAQAHDGSVRARIGHHNDAFLAEWGNDGTYGRDGDGPDDDPVLRRYVSTETLYVPNGGETNVENSSRASIVAQHDTTIAELSRFHWSFCGSEYAQAVTNKWRNNGTFAEMEKRLGYRFQMKTGTYPAQASKGGTMPIQITLVNKGFAPMYNYRPVYLVLKNAQHTYSLPLQADPRKWTAEAGTITLNESPALPATMAEGTYHLYLHLPDAYESLASDPRYSVRFANQNVWDQNTGMNDLGTTVEVVAGGQAIVNTQQTELKPQKEFRDGRVMIVRGDKTYSVLGVEE